MMKKNLERKKEGKTSSSSSLSIHPSLFLFLQLFLLPLLPRHFKLTFITTLFFLRTPPSSSRSSLFPYSSAHTTSSSSSSFSPAPFSLFYACHPTSSSFSGPLRNHLPPDKGAELRTSATFFLSVGDSWSQRDFPPLLSSDSAPIKHSNKSQFFPPSVPTTYIGAVTEEGEREREREKGARKVLEGILLLL